VSESERVTVVVGRFEPLVGCGVAHALGEDPRVHVLASGLEDAALEDAVAQQLPRVVILGEAGNYALVVRLRSRGMAPGVLVLAQEQPMLWTALLAAGARCLARSASPVELIVAVHLAARARRTSTSGDGQRAEQTILGGVGPLTDREMEVLKYLIENHKYAEIAHKMSLSETTVKTYSARIRRKLGVKSRRELRDMAIPGQPGTEAD
jgi:DNA-binding NarL/FixJ family response regulator